MLIVLGSEAAVQALEAALAGLAAEPAAAHGGNAEFRHAVVSPKLGERAGSHSYHEYKQPWLFSSLGGGAGWYCISCGGYWPLGGWP